MKIINTEGKKCPMPLIETKKAINESKNGESIKVIIDNETSVKNVMHFLNDNGIVAEQKGGGNSWEILINKKEGQDVKTEAESYCSTGPGEKKKQYIMLFAKNRIGEGSDELGEALVDGLLNALKGQDTLPDKMIFMNSGIDLVTEGSIVLPHLAELEKQGVELIACGTCLDYFDKMDLLKIGRISNMFEILESMRSVDQVLSI